MQYMPHTRRHDSTNLPHGFTLICGKNFGIDARRDVVVLIDLRLRAYLPSPPKLGDLK